MKIKTTLTDCQIRQYNRFIADVESTIGAGYADQFGYAIGGSASDRYLGEMADVVLEPRDLEDMAVIFVNGLEECVMSGEWNPHGGSVVDEDDAAKLKVCMTRLARFIAKTKKMRPIPVREVETADFRA